MGLRSNRHTTWLLMKSVVFCVGILSMLWAINYVMTPAQGLVDPWAAVAQTSGEVDVVALGSSHTHCTVLPMEMWRAAGVTALDITSGGQVMAVTAAYLKEALRKHKPKVVLLDVHMMGAQAVFKDRALAHANLDYMPMGLARAQGITRSLPASAWAGFFFPLETYHSRWVALGPGDFSPSKYTSGAYARGSLYLPMAKPLDGVVTTSAVGEAAYQADLPYLREIAARCDEMGAQLVLVTSPGLLAQQVGKVPLAERMRADLSGEYPSVRVLDLRLAADDAGVSMATDYKDEGHLNQRGAVKISVWLARYLAGEFDLADHRSDAFADQWNLDLAKYDEVFVTGW